MAVNSPSRKPRLFLSYGHCDAMELALRLRSDLEANGYSIWQDEERIRAGRAWTDEIRQGLRESELVIALLSPHSVRRKSWGQNPDDQDSVCLDEIEYAVDVCRIPVLPVMAVSCEPPFRIFRLQYLDLRSWEESAARYQQLKTKLLDAVPATLSPAVFVRSVAAMIAARDSIYAGMLKHPDTLAAMDEAKVAEDLDPSGRLLYSVDKDGKLGTWSAENLRPLAKISLTGEFMELCTLIGDDELLVVSDDGTVLIWDLLMGHQRASLCVGELTCASNTVDGRFILIGNGAGDVFALEHRGASKGSSGGSK
jgi:hypothetical protein